MFEYMFEYMCSSAKISKFYKITSVVVTDDTQTRGGSLYMHHHTYPQHCDTTWTYPPPAYRYSTPPRTLSAPLTHCTGRWQVPSHCLDSMSTHPLTYTLTVVGVRVEV